MDDDHVVIVYECGFCKNAIPDNGRWWSVDCGDHLYSHHTPYFFDAIGTAMLHRGAAIR